MGERLYEKKKDFTNNVFIVNKKNVLELKSNISTKTNIPGYKGTERPISL